jgi:hypothetical protein
MTRATRLNLLLGLSRGSRFSESLVVFLLKVERHRCGEMDRRFNDVRLGVMLDKRPENLRYPADVADVLFKIEKNLPRDIFARLHFKQWSAEQRLNAIASVIAHLALVPFDQVGNRSL